MFNVLYKYFTNCTDTPSVLFKLNIWSFINIRFFKFKFTRNILYFIQNLNGLRLNSILYFYKDWVFEDLFFKLFKYIFVFIILFLIF